MKNIIGRINPEDRNVTIWGAGFSGLVLGYYLKEQGYRVTIYEKNDHPGGKIHTKKKSVGLIETGANALYMNADVMDLLKELKLEPLPAAKKLKRYILIKGKPRKPFQFSLFSRSAFNAKKKPPLITDGLTVAEFFRPLMGQEKVNDYISPALGGIYAATAEQLHFRSVFHEVAQTSQYESYWAFFKQILKNKKATPRLEISGSVSFEGGMQTLINRLADELKGHIKYNYKEPFRIKGNTILCTDAYNASLLTKEVRPEVSAELARIRYQELSSVTVFMKREIRSLQKSFGVLIPLESGFNSIGVLNQKAIFPSNHENVYSYTFIAKKPCTKEEIMADIKSLYYDFVPEDIDYIDNNYWERGLPIYNLQRYLSVKKLNQLLKDDQNFAIFGNYVAGISLREMVSAARGFKS